MYPYYDQGYSSYPYNAYPARDFPHVVSYNGRVYSRKPSVMKPSVWIERGPDGHPYYVREKLRLPSLRNLFLQAANDLRSNLQHRRLSDSVVSVPSTQPSNPLPPSQPQRPPSKSSLKKSGSNMPQQNFNLQPPPFVNSQPFATYPSHNPYQSSTIPKDVASDNNDNTKVSLVQQPQFYPAPHPRMWPVAPPAGQHYPALPGPTGMPATVTPSTFNAPNSFQYPPQTGQAFPMQTGPNIAQPYTNPFVPNSEDQKYKCTVCGRFRSARYHWKHPIPPGALPRATICRKCREDATDSEDESTDSYEEKDYRRRSKSRRRSRVAKTRSRSRARSSGRADPRTQDFDYYKDFKKHRAGSASSSDSEERRRHASRARRERSSSIEVVHYRPQKPKSRKKKVIYVEDNGQPVQDLESDEEPQVEYVSFPRRRSSALVSRSSTPLRRQSDPYLANPIVIERREYFERAPSVQEYRQFHQPSQFTSRELYRSGQPLHYEDDDRYRDRHRRQGSSQYYEDDDDDRHRGRDRAGTGVERGRNRSRSRFSIDEGAEAGPRGSWVPRTSNLRNSEHNRRSSSLGYVDVQGDTNSTSRQRSQRHRSRTRDQPRPRRLDDEVTVMEEVQGEPTDGYDYDYYDKDGMRVKVREI